MFYLRSLSVLANRIEVQQRTPKSFLFDRKKRGFAGKSPSLFKIYVFVIF